MTFGDVAAFLATNSSGPVGPGPSWTISAWESGRGMVAAFDPGTGLSIWGQSHLILSGAVVSVFTGPSSLAGDQFTLVGQGPDSGMVGVSIR